MCRCSAKQRVVRRAVLATLPPALHVQHLHPQAPVSLVGAGVQVGLSRTATVSVGWSGKHSCSASVSVSVSGGKRCGKHSGVKQQWLWDLVGGLLLTWQWWAPA
jgi:hypothetical protein